MSVAKSLMQFEGSLLDTKYAESHHKVAIKYKEHLIEISGDDDNKYIKYVDEKIPISSSEYKQLYSSFCEELNKRKARTTERFNELEKLVKNGKGSH
ncbi:MAG TPA: hypothetical protein PKK00_02870 [Bacteroidales bacterium]|nr:hypothetical protein [Bacteroidales bacterium]HPS16416.1 hypothetical protein [Bacteroidales bacterium]